MQRRVVITGIGCVTPLGCEVARVWDNLLNGRSGVVNISLFDASRFPIRIAAEVRDWQANASTAGSLAARLPRQSQFAVSAGVQAWHSAGLSEGSVEPSRAGISLGCGEIFPDFHALLQSASMAAATEELDLDEFLNQYRSQSPERDDMTLEPGAPLGILAGQLGIQGWTKNYTTACASSSIALGEALEAIRRNDLDVMLAGGAHSMVHPLGVMGFHRLSVLSCQNGNPAEAYRPFDKMRDGFVIGEGCVIFVLEELEHALRRDAAIWAELIGYGSTHDAYRVTDVQPQGRGAALSIKNALADARINPDQIGYINAHGSGTQTNDAAETRAIKSALGPAAYHIPISSTKSMTGHLTTACGAIETLSCVLSVRDGVAPPTINYEHPDPVCDLDYLPNQAREITSRIAVNNNFGFGGNNVALVVSQYNGS